jgi:hypothetical protein
MPANDAGQPGRVVRGHSGKRKDKRDKTATVERWGAPDDKKRGEKRVCREAEEASERSIERAEREEAVCPIGPRVSMT